MTITFGLFLDFMIVIALASFFAGMFFAVRGVVRFLYKKKDSPSKKHPG